MECSPLKSAFFVFCSRNNFLHRLPSLWQLGIVHRYRPPAVISSSFFFSETKWAKPLYSNWKQPHLHTSLLDKQGKGMPQREVRCIYSQLTAVWRLLIAVWWLIDWLLLLLLLQPIHTASSVFFVDDGCSSSSFQILLPSSSFFFTSPTTVQMKANRVWRNS